MIELHRESCLSDKLEKATDGVATDLGGQPAGDSTAPADSPQVAGADQNNADLPKTAIVSLIRTRLEQHPHFRGRAALLQIELVEETIVLSGRLPTHYLKQLLQEAIRLIPDVVDIDNRVFVMQPNQ
jgi:hypothetical protein